MFQEPYFSSDYILSQFDMQKCKIIFSRIMTCHFRDKKMKKIFSSFFFSVKILLRDSILDSHRYHSYITFLPVRELVLFCMHSTMTRTQHFGVRPESRKMKQVSSIEMEMTF